MSQPNRVGHRISSRCLAGHERLEALLLIGVATAGRYLQCYEKSAIHGGNIKKCFMEIDILQLFECANKKIFIVCEVAKDE